MPLAMLMMDCAYARGSIKRAVTQFVAGHFASAVDFPDGSTWQRDGRRWAG